MLKPVRRLILPAAAATLLLSPRQQFAAPFTEAHVTKIINEVKLVDPARGDRKAAVNDIVRDDIGLGTGLKSRSELQFADQTLTRIGPESYFSFKAGTRDMTLERGTMLLQVPKGIGGATIHTAAVTASITGTTIMIEHTPGTNLKVLVLEGSLRLSVNGRFGDSLLLTPGKMVIMKPDAKRIPDPVAIDLAKLTKTSSLVNMGNKKNGPSLPSIALIEKEVANQEREKSQSTLIPTNLVIAGHGTDVQLDTAAIAAQVDQRDTASAGQGGNSGSDGTDDGDGSNDGGNNPSPTPEPSSTPSPTPGASPTPMPPGASPTPTPHFITFAKDGVIWQPIAGDNLVITAPHDLDIDATVFAEFGTFEAGHNLNFNSSAAVENLTLSIGHDLHYSAPFLFPARNGALTFAPGSGRTLTIYARKLDVNAIGGRGPFRNPITLDGGDAWFLSGFEGGNGGTLNLGTATNPISGDVHINSDISATTGANGFAVPYGGAGGHINLNTNGQATVNSTIQVSSSTRGRASKSGGQIHIVSTRTSGSAISITSSAQLLALLANAAPGPGGSIILTSAGGDINVNGTAKADRGLVEITNTGNNGKVTLNNATLHGETVKAGALGSNGTLTISGGSIDANTAIKLFAGGSNGHVTFTNNVTLAGNSVKTIAGDTVTINNGKVVTVLGNTAANVFTNHPNYTGFGGNGTTSGTFAGQGAITQPLSALPSGY